MGCLIGSLSAILVTCKEDGVITSVMELRHAVRYLHLSPNWLVEILQIAAAIQVL